MTNVPSQVEVTCSPKHNIEIVQNEAFAVAITPVPLPILRYIPHGEYEVILERNSSFNHQKFIEIQQKTQRFLLLHRHLVGIEKDNTF